MSRGNIVILAILISAATAGGFAVWFHNEQTKHVRDAFGPQVANLIATASDAEVYRLEPVLEADVAQDDEVLLAVYNLCRVAERKEIGKSRGFINLRAALVKDHSYNWQSELSPPPPTDHSQFQYALVFGTGPKTAKLFLNLENKWMAIEGSEATFRFVNIEPMAPGLRQFIDEQFAQEQNP